MDEVDPDPNNTERYHTLALTSLVAAILLVWVVAHEPSTKSAMVLSDGSSPQNESLQSTDTTKGAAAGTSATTASSSEVAELFAQTKAREPSRTSGEMGKTIHPITDCAPQWDAPAFYIDPSGQAIKQEHALRSEGKLREADMLRSIACEPVAVWLMGGASISATESKIQSVLASTTESMAVPVFVLYNQPATDHAAWGSGRNGAGYDTWIKAIADTIGTHEAWVILEPDALATTASYDSWHRKQRLSQLADAVTILSKHSNARIYIDAGHSHWLSVEDTVAYLRLANIEDAHGFALNVANYRTTSDEEAYGHAIADTLDDAHFVVDTARNGNGPHPDAVWCNAPGRAIGPSPRLVNGQQLDAYLWVKPPGESDGHCNGGPAAGRFWLSYALSLIENSEL